MKFRWCSQIKNQSFFCARLLKHSHIYLSTTVVLLSSNMQPCNLFIPHNSWLHSCFWKDLFKLTYIILYFWAFLLSGSPHGFYISLPLESVMVSTMIIWPFEDIFRRPLFCLAWSCFFYTIFITLFDKTFMCLRIYHSVSPFLLYSISCLSHPPTLKIS